MHFNDKLLHMRACVSIPPNSIMPMPRERVPHHLYGIARVCYYQSFFECDVHSRAPFERELICDHFVLLTRLSLNADYIYVLNSCRIRWARHRLLKGLRGIFCRLTKCLRYIINRARRCGEVHGLSLDCTICSLWNRVSSRVTSI